MSYRVWYSTESFADYIIDKTILADRENVTKSELAVSDAKDPKDFHKIPDHIKQILYLDSPDIIVEFNNEPIFSIEISTEAPTGHNTYQRFARLVASVENNVPAFYIFTEAAIINRASNNSTRWDKINPLVFKALDRVMSFYNIPALLYYFPSDFRDYRNNPLDSPNYGSKGLKYDATFISEPDSTDNEMQLMFKAMNEIITIVEKHNVIRGREKLLSNQIILERKDFMQAEYFRKNGNMNMSPVTATDKIPTQFLLNYLLKYENANYQIGELLRNREETIIYKMNSELRGDPYTGVFAAIDYLLCREGKTFEERRYNLVLCVGKLGIDEVAETLTIINDPTTKTIPTILDFVKDVKSGEKKNLLNKDFNELKNNQIPRYYMQVRYGSMFSKNKHIRVFSYFADAILFPDGSLWRDA
jgi:hypothetical protein